MNEVSYLEGALNECVVLPDVTVKVSAKQLQIVSVYARNGNYTVFYPAAKLGDNIKGQMPIRSERPWYFNILLLAMQWAGATQPFCHICGAPNTFVLIRVSKPGSISSLVCVWFFFSCLHVMDSPDLSLDVTSRQPVAVWFPFPLTSRCNHLQTFCCLF